MRRLSAFLIVCGLAVQAVSSSTAAPPETATAAISQWPQWRGPARDGISPATGLLADWPADGPREAWRAKGLGRGFSSVSLADGRIFTMGDAADGQYVIALDQRDGRELWRTRMGDVWEPGGYAGPRATPTVDEALVYGLGPHGDLVCLEAATGKPVWRRQLAADFGGRMHSGWGFSESPLIDGDRLVCTPGGAEAALVDLDKLTGREIWRASMPAVGAQGGDGAAYSSIVVSRGGGVRQYVQLMGRGAVGFAARDGRFLWGYNKVANGTANVPTPLVQGDFVFCSSGYGAGAALLRLNAEGDTVRAEEVYFLDGKEFQNHHGGMVLLGDHVYAGHGHNAGAPTCLDWKTGKIVWRQARGPGSGSAAVTCAAGRLYLRFENGLMALVGATPERYQEHGRFQIPDVEQPSWSHPVVADGRLYLREQDTLHCYDISS